VPPDGLRDALQTGDLVSAYRIVDVLGTGGMGWVYRAEHVVQAHVAALKLLRAEQLRLDRAVDRMMREATILASVAHDGIPQLFECGVLADRRPWIAMELVPGAPLATRMTKGTLAPSVVCDVLRGASAVLATAHERGVTHRDLKPDNILLDGSEVHVIDWGIAHHIEGARYTSHNEAIGTPTYMAPEQARGGPTGGFCDVYGLGIVAYQALAGRAPFVGQSSVEILVQHLNRPVPPLAPRCPQAPVGLVELVERMLCKNLETRPTAHEVVHAIDELRTQTCAPTYLSFEVEDTGPVPLLGDDERATNRVPL